MLFIQHKQNSWNQTIETGGQVYRDTSPYEVSECSWFDDTIQKA